MLCVVYDGLYFWIVCKNYYVIIVLLELFRLVEDIIWKNEILIGGDI